MPARKLIGETREGVSKIRHERRRKKEGWKGKGRRKESLAGPGREKQTFPLEDICMGWSTDSINETELPWYEQIFAVLDEKLDPIIPNGWNVKSILFFIGIGWTVRVSYCFQSAAGTRPNCYG